MTVQVSADYGDVCPTPDAPRTQTKAPRLDVYRPAPRVVVDTGRPGRNKPPQERRELQHMSRPQDHDPVVSRTQSRHQDQPVPSQAQPMSVPKDHGPVAAQTQIKTSAMSEPNDNHVHHSSSVHVQTNPSGGQNTRSEAKRLEGSNPIPARAPDKPQTTKDRGKPQVHIKPSKPKAVEDEARKIDANQAHRDHRHHHRHHHQNQSGVKGQGSQGLERNKNTNATVSRTDVPAAAADADYAVKYRLGLVPRRSNEPKRRSEYQRQFQWRSFDLNSPLMSAAKVTVSLVVLSLRFNGHFPDEPGLAGVC